MLLGHMELTGGGVMENQHCGYWDLNFERIHPRALWGNGVGRERGDLREVSERLALGAKLKETQKAQSLG